MKLHGPGPSWLQAGLELGRSFCLPSAEITGTHPMPSFLRLPLFFIKEVVTELRLSQLEFDPWHLHVRRERTPTNCPLTFTRAMAHLYLHTQRCCLLFFPLWHFGGFCVCSLGQGPFPYRAGRLGDRTH